MKKMFSFIIVVLFSFLLFGCKEDQKQDKYITITFELNGATLFNDQIVSSDLIKQEVILNDIIQLPTVYKEGFEFVGWASGGENYYDTASFDKDTTLSAIFDEIKTIHTITYNVDGGTILEDVKYEYVYPSKYILPTCNKEGFIFLGWYESPSFLTEEIKEIDESFDYDVVLYAKFVKIKGENPTITYNLDGGYFLEEDSPLYEYVIGEKYKLLEPEKEDFYFDGWYLDSNFTSRKITYIMETDYEDFVLYAKWEPIYETRIIAYDLNGGQFKGVIAPDWYYEGKGCELPTPQRRGYDFLGWLDSSNNKIIYSLNARSFGNKILIAQWEKIYKYSNIYYELNGGEITEEVNKYPEEKGIDLPIPKKSGYFFRGYYLNSNFVGEAIYRIHEAMYGDVTLYAKWVEANLENAYISIYGDSISTFKDMIPEGYSYFYPMYSDSVKTYEETWWGLLIKNNNSSLLVNNSYSGTAVCGGTNQGNDTDRMKLLAKDGINPDIVIIYLGINDVVNNRTPQTFEATYIAMVNKMKKMYPSCFIFASTLPYESNTNKKYPGLRNEFSEIIRKVSVITNIGLLDIEDCITPNNYTTRLVDTIHPNKYGMNEIYKKMEEELINYFDNYHYHKINYYLDGGEFIAPNYIKEFSEINVATYLPTPIKEGYKFLGWFNEFGEEIKYLKPGINTSINLKAKWEKITKKNEFFQVKFIDILGQETIKNYQYGDNIGELNISSNNVYLDGVTKITKDSFVLSDMEIKEVPIYVYEIINKVFGDGYLYDDLVVDKSYSTTSGKVSFSFTSSDEYTITKTGLVNPGRSETLVTISAKFQLLQEEFDYRFNVIVKPIEFRDLTNVKPVIAYLNINCDKLEINNLVSSSVDIAVYSFSRVTSNFTVDNSELKYLDNVFRLRKEGIRVLLCLGAYASASVNFSNCAATEDGRKKLANSILETIEKYHFDGVDLDWEYPGYETGRATSVDRPNFTLLIKEIFDTIKTKNSDYILSSAIPGGIFGYSRYELSKLNEYLDYINLMTYDLQNSSKVTHHAALFDSSYSPYGSAKQSVDLFSSLGVSKNKLVVGAAFYGRVFTLTESLIDSEVLGSTKVSDGNKNITFTSIYNDYLSKMFSQYNTLVRIWDEEAKAPILYDKTKKIAISYDDRESIKLKCQYVLDNDLGGIMFWCYGEDLTYTLLDAIYDVMK